jgi:RNA polymerase sigma-70 factor (ECF subfamily)
MGVPNQAIPPVVWERFRTALSTLARLRIDPRVQAKLDLSGVVQQTLLEAFQAQERWTAGDEGRQLAYLRRVLGNNLADALRYFMTEKRDQSLERPLLDAASASSSRLQQWLAADQTSPSDAAVRGERDLTLADTLNALPEAQREALILQHWHGWSLSDIGERLGRSPAAVAGLIKRGLQTLRTRLQNWGEP